MKTLEFLYQETQIHFLVNPLDKNVMVNATEMANIYNKRADVFLKTDHAKAFIEVANRPPNGGQIIENRGRNGIYFNKRLALKFAAWLSPEFEYWVYSTIDEIIFGNYQKHWEAHAEHEMAKIEMLNLKREMLTKASLETNQAFFDAVERMNNAKKRKTKAIRNQLKLFID